MFVFRGLQAERLLRGLGLAAGAVALVATGWFSGHHEANDEVARLKGEIDAMVNDQVEACLVEKTLSPESGSGKIDLALYDFGDLVCNTAEQAQLLIASNSLQKRIVGRICSRSLR